MIHLIAICCLLVDCRDLFLVDSGCLVQIDGFALVVLECLQMDVPQRDAQAGWMPWAEGSG